MNGARFVMERYSWRRAAPLTIVALLLLAYAPGVHAQRTALPTLPDRLTPAARAAITATIDTARAAGLPTEPLTAKAAEGVLKGADDQRIVDAVRSLARALDDARAALGPDTDPSVLDAGASALRAGVTPAALRALAHPDGGRAARPDPAVFATALVTLVDLVAKGVPAATASGSVGQLLHAGSPESRFVTLRLQVEQDIRRGQSPEAALRTRVRHDLRQEAVPPAPATPPVSPSPSPPHASPDGK